MDVAALLQRTDMCDQTTIGSQWPAELSGLLYSSPDEPGQWYEVEGSTPLCRTPLAAVLALRCPKFKIFVVFWRVIWTGVFNK
jgi:hypothetical protein